MCWILLESRSSSALFSFTYQGPVQCERAEQDLGRVDLGHDAIEGLHCGEGLTGTHDEEEEQAVKCNAACSARLLSISFYGVCNPEPVSPLGRLIREKSWGLRPRSAVGEDKVWIRVDRQITAALGRATVHGYASGSADHQLLGLQPVPVGDGVDGRTFLAAVAFNFFTPGTVQLVLGPHFVFSLRKRTLVRETLEGLTATGRIRDGLTPWTGHPYPSVYGSNGLHNPANSESPNSRWRVPTIPISGEQSYNQNGCTRPFWLPESQAYGTGTGRIVPSTAVDRPSRSTVRTVGSPTSFVNRPSHAQAAASKAVGGSLEDLEVGGGGGGGGLPERSQIETTGSRTT
ncbi:hypothetical protein B0H19DRAFT_1238648 [Mycena capillaripes]|nr:hypothetical protein B0H19DRAFT_1238648 [Mycena capillaripes]